ncbi:MAG: ribose 5-phosphate isomerase A [Longimicrobiales bacterium]
MSGEVEERKRQAAERAVDHVESGMRLGLGTGSTARHMLDSLAERLRDGSLRDIIGVPTSRETETYARRLGIPLATLNEQPRLDLTLDGADEIDPRLDLIKGHGGALLWEKIVATASQRMLVIADARKRVSRLGETVALPIEVVPFGWRTHLRFLEGIGATPTLRSGDDGEAFVTDAGHFIIDCAFEGGIADPYAIHTALSERAGIVETGLFLGIAKAAVIAGPAGVEVVTRSSAA